MCHLVLYIRKKPRTCTSSTCPIIMSFLLSLFFPFSLFFFFTLMAQNVKAPCSKGPQCILSMKRLFNYLHGVSIKQIIITARCYVLINCIVWGWCLLCSLPSLNQLINAALHWSIESVLGKEDSIQWWRCFVWWCVGIHCQVYLAEYVFYNVGPTGLEKSFKKKRTGLERSMPCA